MLAPIPIILESLLQPLFRRHGKLKGTQSGFKRVRGKYTWTWKWYSLLEISPIHTYLNQWGFFYGGSRARSCPQDLIAATERMSSVLFWCSRSCFLNWKTNIRSLFFCLEQPWETGFWKADFSGIRPQWRNNVMKFIVLSHRNIVLNPSQKAVDCFCSEDQVWKWKGWTKCYNKPLVQLVRLFKQHQPKSDSWWYYKESLGFEIENC